MAFHEFYFIFQCSLFVFLLLMSILISNIIMSLYKAKKPILTSVLVVYKVTRLANRMTLLDNYIYIHLYLFCIIKISTRSFCFKLFITNITTYYLFSIKCLKFLFLCGDVELKKCSSFWPIHLFLFIGNPEIGNSGPHFASKIGNPILEIGN